MLRARTPHDIRVAELCQLVRVNQPQNLQRVVTLLLAPVGRRPPTPGRQLVDQSGPHPVRPRPGRRMIAAVPHHAPSLTADATQPLGDRPAATACRDGPATSRTGHPTTGTMHPPTTPPGHSDGMAARSRWSKSSAAASSTAFAMRCVLCCCAGQAASDRIAQSPQHVRRAAPQQFRADLPRSTRWVQLGRNGGNCPLVVVLPPVVDLRIGASITGSNVI